MSLHSSIILKVAIGDVHRVEDKENDGQFLKFLSSCVEQRSPDLDLTRIEGILPESIYMGA